MGPCAAASADVAEALEVQAETPAATTQLRLEIGSKVIPHPDKVGCNSIPTQNKTLSAYLVCIGCSNICILVAGIVWWRGCILHKQLWGWSFGSGGWSGRLAGERHQPCRCLPSFLNSPSVLSNTVMCKLHNLPKQVQQGWTSSQPTVTST